MFRKSLHILLFGTLLFAGCRKGVRPFPYTIKDGHERMVAMLDSIAQFADPLTCDNLNTQYVEILRKDLIRTPNDELPEARTRFAAQLIYAGKPGQALIELTTLTHDQGDSITTANKTQYELLALAYQRLGEMSNAIDRHNAASYIIPIQPGGYYMDLVGARSATKIYQRLLKAFPADSQNKWLLNIAYMNLGQYPDSVPVLWRIDPNLFKKSEHTPSFVNKAVSLKIDDRGMGGGVCLEDFDNDGDLDLFLIRSGLRDQCRYLVNEKGKFKDRTDAANLTGIVSGSYTIQADYDNDGDADILILRGGGLKGGTHPNSLLRNNGNNTFTDVTIDAGLLSFHPTQAAVWADYDGDGWLDLYIANESRDSSGVHPNELYHNNGNGTFTNTAHATGVDLVGFFKSVAWGDINNDQRPDLYLSNLEGNNRLFANRGAGKNNRWIMQDISVKAGVTAPMHSFPTRFWDYNNDGLDDIIVLGYNLDPARRPAGDVLDDWMGKSSSEDYFRLYRNNGDETFTDVHIAANLHHITYSMGCNLLDFDNDGWMDIYLETGTPDMRALVPNRLFQNIEGKRFKDVSMNGTAHLQKSWNGASGDLDNDGDLDIYAVIGGTYEGDIGHNAYFQNPGNTNHWLQIQLVGQRTCRDAQGAKIVARIRTEEGKKRNIWATCGGAAGNHRVHLGLGNAIVIDQLEIFWPTYGAPTTLLKTVPMDTLLRITEMPGNQ